MNIYRVIASSLGATLLVVGSISAQVISGQVLDNEGKAIIGANIWWENTTVGTATDSDGQYNLHRVKDHDRLIAASIGFVNDTIDVMNRSEDVDFKLHSSLEFESVVVNSTLNGNYIKQTGIAKSEVISFAGLCKMACCNLAESFENSASVTVGFSDAISGARQIQMLGLAGTYTQILDENRAIMRGISAPYGLSYTPGMWLNSIQVSKGISSVTAGHEAITGQINLEHRKPTDSERLFLNLYLNSELRPEINLSTAQPVGDSGKLSTILLLHASGDTDAFEIDHNSDGFRDLPASQQYNIANRWSYLADSGAQLRWGFKLLEEDRLGGMYDYDNDDRYTMYDDGLYGSEIKNRGANAYFKFGMPLGAAVYDDETEDELRSNIAFVADFDYFDEDAYFGLNEYAGRESAISMSMMYNRYFTPRSSLIMGVSTHLQSINESLINNPPSWSEPEPKLDLSRDENEVGLYAEYTYKLGDKFSFIAGLRGDYNSYYDNYLATPRSQFRWSITPSTTLRGSVGLGHRTTNVITDNIGVLATGRKIIFMNGIDSDFDRQERATTFGGSLTQTFKILKPGDATISIDYFKSEFSNYVMVDQEWSSDTIMIYNSDQPYSTDTYQIDLTWSPMPRLDIFATYRYTDSKATFTRPDGTYYRSERPLISRYKTLFNLQYATNMRRWTFDATAQLNGPTRIPNQEGAIESSEYSPAYPMFYAQVSRRISSWEIYVGCENIGNYMQDDPIISAENPFSESFNSTLIWGPLMGRKFYIGARFNLY